MRSRALRAYVAAIACALLVVLGFGGRAHAAAIAQSKLAQVHRMAAPHKAIGEDGRDDDDRIDHRHACVHSRHRGGRIAAWKAALPSIAARPLAERVAAPRPDVRAELLVRPRAHDARGPPVG